MWREEKVISSNKKHDMFKHKKGKKTPKRVTINDIFALKQEVKLTAKLIGVPEERIELIYKELKRDLLRSSFIGRGSYSLTLKAFSELTPMFKPHFERCTIDNMGLLLNEFRKDVEERNKKEPGKFSRRRQKPESLHFDDLDPKGRLFPMGKSWYNTRFQFIFYQRFGNKAFRTATFRDKPDDYGYLATRIHEGKLKFIGTTAGIEITSENYKKILKMGKETDGNLQKFFNKESKLKGGGKT